MLKGRYFSRIALFDPDLWAEVQLSISKNRMRTLLTAFSVVWGVFILIMLLGLGRGLENGVIQQFSDATNAIWFGGGATTQPYGGYNLGKKITISNDDFEMLNHKIPDIENLAGVCNINSRELIHYNGKTARVNLQAISVGHQVTENLGVVYGRLLNNQDIAHNEKHIIIGDMIQVYLFGDENPIGKLLNIQGKIFKIVGVFSDTFENERLKVYMPLSTGQTLFNRGTKVDLATFTINTPSVLKSDKSISLLKEIFGRKYSFSVDDDGAMWFSSNIKNYGNYMILFKNMRVFIWLIGLGSLVSGIMGVSNIMIVSIKERVREIGVRKAIGATPFSIISQILLESIIIVSISGYLGLLLGLLTIQSLQGVSGEYFINPGIPFQIAVYAVVIISFLGVIAGIWPALNAAYINPIKALHEE